MHEYQFDPNFENLLEYLKGYRAFDFTGYKRPNLMRRIHKRMQALDIDNCKDYLDYLEVHPNEFKQLFNTILINVTCFFRDRPFWNYLIEEIIPRIFADKERTEPIRVWSAGCATGEEAYTLAMAIAEVIGIDQFHQRVKIYATDVDEEALSFARQACYSPKDILGISPEMLELYFEQNAQGYIFRKDLRASVIFGSHDLIQDAPISRVDLLVCRNTLMYFNAEAQGKILTRFNLALRERGFLFLGKAEMLLTHTNLFKPIDLNCRIFTKVSKANLSDRLMLIEHSVNQKAIHHTPNQMHWYEVGFDNTPIAQIVVDFSGFLVLANERARNLFAIDVGDMGRALQDLEIFLRPVELRSPISQAYNERRNINIVDIEWQTQSGKKIYLNILISPLIDNTNSILGVLISFTDVTHYKGLQEELEHTNEELKIAYEELQSSNEELATTNEELQSTNEELEVINEELDSSNEELHTINYELQRRSEELNQSNAFLESILSSLQGGVVVLNRNLEIEVWNWKNAELWGLRTIEALGKNFFSLDIGLPVEQLRSFISDCLTNNSNQSYKTSIYAINAKGKTIKCQVIINPLITSQNEIQGVILLIEA